MSEVRDAALGFEAVKVAMSQTAAGTKIVLVIHPNDVPKELFSDPLGSRYQVALVLLDDQGEPVIPKSRTDGERAVVSAGMLCRESKFHEWLWSEGRILIAQEHDATLYLKTYCGIQSRSELRDNEKARAKFDSLKKQFNERKI